jgi:site-specific DNA recombinase
VNDYLHQDQLIGKVDGRLAREFARRSISATQQAISQASRPGRRDPDNDGVMRKIAECDRKRAQYRTALDSGASPATVATWIAETEGQKARYSA